MIPSKQIGDAQPTHGDGEPGDESLSWRERYLTYRFYLHQHPFAQDLGQRLLRDSIRGLQAADTDYATGAQPGSLRVKLGEPVAATVSAGGLVMMTGSVTATLGNGQEVTLNNDHQFRLASDAPLTLPAGLRLVLAEGADPCPAKGATLHLDAQSKARPVGDSRVELAGGASIELESGGGIVPPGTRVNIPKGTPIIISAATPLALTHPTSATVLHASPRPQLYAEFFNAYQPDAANVRQPYPVKDLDFEGDGAYAVYNWELFYHVPFALAVHLSKNQRFAEAQRWFHFLFDPTDDSDGPEPQRYWKVRPFHTTEMARVEEVLVNLVTHEDADLFNATVKSVDAWQKAPFRPHVVARFRQQAYMWKTVMAYLDNLIDWGDSLFRQDTGEAIDEALQLYVLAANILGPRPQAVPRKDGTRPQTYANLRRDLALFGTALRNVEADLPMDIGPKPGPSTVNDGALSTLSSIARVPYFRVPPNDKLLGYWDTVADRLFKIRNSLNLQGVFRQLPLFEPPIDPALLARAAAAGLDIGAVVNGLNQPMPLVRFQLLVQKAAEIAQEVKALGGGLLSAMEKEEGEALAVLRARHERTILEAVEQVKYSQHQEAVKAREGLEQSLAIAVQRYTYYERQLGRDTADIVAAIPELGELDKEALAKLKLDIAEPSMPLRDIPVNIARSLDASGGKIVSSFEQQEMLQLKTAQDLQQEGAALSMVAKVLALIPELGAQAEPWGVGAALQFGGRALSTMLSMAADASSSSAGRSSYEASKAAKIGGYERREQDWTFQSNLAAGEITQVFKQLRAAQIREAIAERELLNHRVQIRQSQEIEQFLNPDGTDRKGKKTNQALYAWMKREVKGLYSQVFQFAFDVARKAERALQRELGDPSLTFLQFNYLAGKEGLLAGEKLHLDINRMELAYHDRNQREYELTKHVSLLQIAPMALVQLRTTGTCTVALPEALFDLDGPGHYFRRIKSVSLSIPCVTGPLAALNCTLTLLRSSVRTSPELGQDGYARGENDSRFDDHFGHIESIVASSAQNDSGLFETNLRDERYLPFESSGVISEWQLRLPANPARGEPALFDYATIADVVLHIRYTAREGGQLLREQAMAAFTDSGSETGFFGKTRLFSVRQEFPTEWARFKAQTETAPTAATHVRRHLRLELRPEHYPFWTQGRLGDVVRVDLLAQGEPGQTPVKVYGDLTGTQDITTLGPSPFGDLLYGRLNNGLPESPDQGSLDLYFEGDGPRDLWVALTWGG